VVGHVCAVLLHCKYVYEFNNKLWLLFWRRAAVLINLYLILRVYRFVVKVYFDRNMNITTHVNRLISSSFYQLRRIKTIRRSLPTTTAITLINSFVISRIDYCNSLLCGLPSYQLARVQSVLDAAVRIIYGGKRFDHVTPLLRDRLHGFGCQNVYILN